MKLLTFNGVTCDNPDVLGYEVRTRYRREGARELRVNSVPRQGTYPRTTSTGLEAREIPVWALHRGSVLTREEYNDTINEIFHLDGLEHTVEFAPTWDSERTLEGQARVTRIEGQEDGVWHVILRFDNPYLMDTDETVETETPVTVDGNTIARPRITLSDVGVVGSRYRALVYDKTGRGAAAWPQVFNVSDTEEVFVNGISVPFIDTGSKTWAYIPISPDQPTIVDLYTGTISPSAGHGMMDTGTLVLENSTATQHHLSGWAVSRNPGAASCQWRPDVAVPITRTPVSVTYGVIEETNNTWVGQLMATRVGEKQHVLPNDYLSVVFTSPVEIEQITGLTRTLECFDPGGVQPEMERLSSARARVLSRQPDQEEWNTISQISAYSNIYGSQGATEQDSSTLSDLNGAVQIAVTLVFPQEHFQTEPGRQSYPLGELRVSGTPVVTYDSDAVPEVILSDPIPCRFIGSGRLRNTTTGESIQLSRVYYDTELVIDCDLLDIYDPEGQDYGQVLPTGGVRMFDLNPGDNAWEVTGDLENASVELRWHDRYGL